MKKFFSFVAAALLTLSMSAQEFNGCGEAFVATSGNAAAGHDGNVGSRWESAFEDPQFWQMNLEEAVTFNRIKIVWEGAYGKTFKINAGMACDALTTIASIEGQVLAGFPYTQIIELASPVTASSIQFEGIERGTPYGYSFWEFEVYEAQTSVLSALDFKAASPICKVGETVALTATPKDQYGIVMESAVSYSVVPATAGTVVDGVYTAQAAGLATVTATAGEFSKSVDIFNYDGENVALQKPVEAEGFNDPARVNDGNDGTEFQADPSNGTAEVDVTCGFTIDLEAVYSLNLVTIHFEGACSDAYTLEVSADKINWELAHSYEGVNGINNHTDMLFGDNLQNAASVRYIRFTSTKNSTQWGMKIFEFQAFGVPGIVSAMDNTEASAELRKLVRNGQIIVVRDGVEYNMMGVQIR